METEQTTATTEEKVVTETVVTDEKVNPEKVAAETDVNAKPSGENASPAGETSEGEDGIEWNQKPATTAAAPSTETDTRPDAEQAAFWKSEFERVSAELNAIKPNVEDSLVKAWSEYKQSEDEPTIAGFLKHVGAVTTTEVDHLKGEDLMKAYHASRAKSKGISDAELEEVISEEMIDYQNAGRLGKLELEEKARQHFSSGKKKSVEDLESEFKTKREAAQNEDKQWRAIQRENLFDFLNRCVAKGKFNDHVADKKWRDQILYVADNSAAVFNPLFVQYTLPDEKGEVHLFTPSVVDFIDTAYFREENKQRVKKTVDKAKVENIEEKAVVAHNQKIVSEIVSTSDAQKDLAYYDAWFQTKGKRHPKDPRVKQE